VTTRKTPRGRDAALHLRQTVFAEVIMPPESAMSRICFLEVLRNRAPQLVVDAQDFVDPDAAR
jgi:hypothetical protein